MLVYTAMLGGEHVFLLHWGLLDRFKDRSFIMLLDTKTLSNFLLYCTFTVAALKMDDIKHF